MFRKNSKPKEETLKLKRQVKQLQSEINQLKQVSNHILVLASQNHRRIVLNLQENLKHRIFSPAKVARSKSPFLKQSKKAESLKKKKPNENKENIQKALISPHFPGEKEVITEESADMGESPETKQRVFSLPEELQNLEKENLMLKRLTELKLENDKLKSQIARPRKTKKNKQSSVLETSQSFATNEKQNRTFTSGKSRSPSQVIRPTNSFSSIFLFPNASARSKSLRFGSFNRSYSKSPSFSIGTLELEMTPRSRSCKNCDFLLHKGRSTSLCTHHDP